MARSSPTLRLVCVLGVLGAGCDVVTRVASVAEPRFTTEVEEGAFQLRRYGERVVAETRVEGSWLEAGNQGFRRLAGYIFGSNHGQGTLAMTAAVGTRRDGRKLAMTAPVGERRDGDAWLVTFTMPEGETLATLPAPRDARVRLRVVPATRVAVIRFSGRWTVSRMQSHTQALRAWTERHGLRAAGEPEVNRFDPPWIPWFMRRNEVWLPLAAD
jgi:hypothetical protein